MPLDDDRKRFCKNEKSSLYSNSSLTVFPSPTVSGVGFMATKVRKLENEKQVEAELPIFQTVIMNYAQTHYYQTDRFANESPKKGETCSNYMSDLVEKFKLQIKAHYSDLIELISIIAFLVRFKLARDTNRIQEGVTM